MIDVDVPETPARSWREFIVQIATIVIGLLIAVGIEKAVTRIDQLDDIAETRDALQHEEALNARISKVLLEEYRRVTPMLETNLAVFNALAGRPGTPAADLPGKIVWNNLTASYLSSAWRTAEAGPVLALMPPREVRRWTELYSRLETAEAYGQTYNDALQKARRYTIRDPDPSKLSRAAIERQIDMMTDLIYAHANRGRFLIATQRRFPAFEGPTMAEVAQIYRNPGDPAARAQVDGYFSRVQKIKDEAE